MTVSEQIRSQITAAEYANCWPSATPPPFSDFIAFTCNAFEQRLPDRVSELAVHILARAENRIGLGGTFVSNSELYEIFGDIVWVPKMSLFRGRPGFNKSLRIESATDGIDDDEFTFRSLAELNNIIHFETWTDYPTKPAIDSCRITMKNAISEFLKQENQSESSKMMTIKQCIESFNQINDHYNSFIDTDIREQIADAVFEIALAGGLDRKIANKIDDWREW